jgi:hypothetical protein
MKKSKKKYVGPGIRGKKIKIYFRTRLMDIPLDGVLLATDCKED